MERIKHTNEYIANSDYYVLIIDGVHRVLIDLDKVDRAREGKWRVKGNVVYSTNKPGPNKTDVSLGRYLFDEPDRHECRRRDCNSLDYRISNMYLGNVYNDKGDYYEVECFEGAFKISKPDYDLVSQNVWHIDPNGYAITKLQSGRVIKQHRLIMDIVDNHDYEVDHINHDTTDNRRENLRLSDRQLNCLNRRRGKYNKSGVVGVYWHGAGNGWAVQLKHSKEHPNGYLGIYKTFEEAVAVRKAAEEEYGISTEW